MGLAIVRSMASAFRPALVLLLLVAGPGSAQPWKEAYERGDVFRALDILQPLVFEPASMALPEQSLDPIAPLYLATYYVNGWRVERDLVIACGLTMLARRTADLQNRYPEPSREALDALEAKTCALLSEEQRLDASAMSACPNIGLAGQTVHLEDAGWVQITQRKFIVDREGRSAEAEVSMCAQHVLPARYRRLVPPPGVSGHPRELLQLFAWQSRVVKGERRRQLMWMAWEVVAGTILPSATEWVADEPGSAWPARPVPERVQFEFRFTRRGEVKYSIVDAAGGRHTGELRSHDSLLKAAREARH